MRATDVRAILFDLDGTLTDRAATVRRYAQRFLEDFGEHFRVADSSAAAAEIARVDDTGYNRNRAADLAAHAAWLSSPGADALAAHWDDHFAVCTQAQPGMLPTIDVLVRSGVRLAVVTNGRTGAQRRKLEALGLRDRLAAVFISEEFGTAKPDQRIFHAAAAALAVHPRDCVFVGDNPVLDVAGASAAGMRPIWFRGTLPWPVDLATPSESIGTLREVLELSGILDRPGPGT